MKRIIPVIVLLALFLIVPNVFGGDEVFEKLTTFGVKGGIWKPGTVYVAGIDDDSDIGYSIEGFLDYKLAPKFSGGLALDFASLGSRDESSTLLMIGFVMKAWIFNDDSKFLMRPGFGIAYGNLGGNDLVDATNHLILNGYFEFVLPTESMNWLFEIGITGSVDGGNDDVEITYGPGFTLRAGLVF